jgi:tRNA A-37 threonylcarbamoyl transferase component Bud32
MNSRAQTSAGHDALKFIGMHGGTIAKHLSPTLNETEMSVSTLSNSPVSLTLKLSYAGQERIIKHFRNDGLTGRTNYLRERDALRIFAKSGLAPKIDFYSDDARFIAMEFIDGKNLRGVIDSKSLEFLCATIGEWLGRFSNAAPFKKKTGSWGDYLNHYPALQQSDIMRQSSVFLQGFRYDKLVLAKNDGALSNLMVSHDGPLFGIDFEHSQFKPMGWDLLLTTRALLRLFPEDVATIISELAKGYCRVTGEDQDLYSAFLKITAVSAAFEIGTGTTETPALTALRTYNKRSSRPAQVVGSVPFLPSRLQTPDPERILKFRQHLVGLDLASVSLKDSRSTGNECVPSIELGAICGACQGSCCTLAVGQKAFIDARTAKRAVNLAYAETPSEVADLYIGYLPEKHVQGSCLFHAQNGCALPREIRSDTCNKFECRSARNLLDKINTFKPDETLCVAGEGSDFHRATCVSHEHGEVSDVPLEMISVESRHA